MSTSRHFSSSGHPPRFPVPETTSLKVVVRPAAGKGERRPSLLVLLSHPVGAPLSATFPLQRKGEYQGRGGVGFQKAQDSGEELLLHNSS